MNKFVKVTNPIREITSLKVEFWHKTTSGECYTCLLHKSDTYGILWKLLKDGIYVRKEFAEAYHLDFTSEE